MKKTLILMLTISFSISCSDDFMEITPKGTLFSSNYFNTEVQVTEALMSTYDVLGHQKGYDLAWSPFLAVAEFLADDAYAGGQDAGDGSQANELNTFKISTANEIVQSIWKRNYFGIYRANFTIEKAEALSDVDISAESKAQIISEAKFLRAYFYFEQVRFFENIPLTTTVQSPSEANISQSSSQDVYNLIAADLMEAVVNLPASYDNRGRATKWAAKALLARVYLFENGVYGNGLVVDGATLGSTEILGHLEDIINDSNHDLESDYTTLFTSAGEFSAENVFEVVYDGSPVNGDWESEQYVEGNLAAQMLGPRVSGGNTYYRGWAFAPPSHKLLLDMTGDPRLSSTILTEADILAEFGTTLNTGAYQHTGYYNGKYTTRLSDRGTVGTPELHNKSNFRAIRYADVLLMAAEIGANVSYLNEVRNRVGLTPIGAYSEDALFEERRMELSLEGIRYFDLLRRGLTVAEAELTTVGEMGPNYTDDASTYDVTFNTATRGFLPIPQTEIDLSNGTLVQNDGY